MTPFSREDIARLRAFTGAQDWINDLADRLEDAVEQHEADSRYSARTEPGWIGFHVWYERGGRVAGRSVYDWMGMPEDGVIRATVYYEGGERVFLVGGEWYVLERTAPRKEGVDGVFLVVAPGETRHKPKALPGCIKAGVAVPPEVAMIVEHEALASRWDG